MEDLYNLIYWGNYDQRIDTLAKMTNENWNFKGMTNNLILKNYLKHTARKLQEEDKIITTDDYWIMNTGLFDSYYESIYIYAEKDLSDVKQNWLFKSFMTPYELGNMGITQLPERANYFEHPEELIFNPNLPINIQYQHILEDEGNLERMKSVTCKNLTSLLRGEIEIMKMKVSANYKLAVPQYYQHKIQLLLPLCLEDGITPDMALVVSKSDSGKYYQGHTCLTLEMAYNNARLIAKPESNWLVP